jgi:polysaccharide chain length determinant protein (PEP-CTERM system associated)
MHPILELIYDELHSIWRFRWIALIAAAVLCVVGWLVVFAMPDRYEAGARVFVDTRTALQPVLEGLTVEQDVDAQLNLVRQSLLGGPQLRKIAEQSGVLPPTETNPARQARVLDAMASRIVLSVRSANERQSDQDAGSIYGISYQDSDRDRALRVTETLLNTLVEQTLGGKRRGSENAQKFLETQIHEYERRLRAAEDRLADFKKQNIGLMPTEQGGYFSQLQSEIDEARKAENDLKIALSRRAELTRQLRGEAVIGAAGTTSVIGGSGVSLGSDTVTRIKETQAKLDELLLRFTEKHPDVIATRETLEELRKRRKAEIESLRRGDANAVATSGAATNPVVQSIQLQLNQADVDIASLNGKLAQHRAKAAELRKRLDTAPQVEAEFAALNRDYDVNKAQYTALLANYEKARLGEQADSAGSVRFEIVQPPNAGFAPVFPRRALFIAGVLLGACALGAGIAYLLHILRPVVGSARSLTALTGMPVLGVVATAFPGRINASLRQSIYRFGFGVACLVGGCVVALMLNWSGFRLGASAAGVG